MPKLWTEIDGEPWLDNPKRRRRRSKGRKRHGRFRKGSKAAKAFMASIRPNKRRGRRRHKKHRAAITRRNPVARRRHHRRHHRRFHRNPLVSARGLTGRVMDGLKGGAGVLIGDAAAGAVTNLVPVAAIQAGPLQGVAEALVGVFGAPFVARWLGAEWGKAFLWGSFARPMRRIAVGLPVLGPALAAYPGNLAAYPGNLAALPSGRASTLTLGDIMSDEEDMTSVY